MRKLTLNAEPEVIELAKRLAAQRGTSVSTMFSEFIEALTRDSRGRPAPITRRLRGVVRVPADKTDRQLLEDALLDRYKR